MKDDEKDDVSTILHVLADQHDDECPLGQAFRGMARAAESSGGPAQVATEQYRRNYEGIFGNKPVVGQA